VKIVSFGGYASEHIQPKSHRTWKAVPVLRLFIHSEMERPTILNRSMPSTVDTIIGIPPVDEADLSVRQLSMENAIHSSQRKYSRWKALFPGTFIQVLMIGD
jgi:hypothetical protein